MAVPQKTKHPLPPAPAIPLLGIIPTRNDSRDLSCTLIVSAAFFTTVSKYLKEQLKGGRIFNFIFNIFINHLSSIVVIMITICVWLS